MSHTVYYFINKTDKYEYKRFQSLENAKTHAKNLSKRLETITVVQDYESFYRKAVVKARFYKGVEKELDDVIEWDYTETVRVWNNIEAYTKNDLSQMKEILDVNTKALAYYVKTLNSYHSDSKIFVGSDYVYIGGQDTKHDLYVLVDMAVSKVREKQKDKNKYGVLYVSSVSENYDELMENVTKQIIRNLQDKGNDKRISIYWKILDLIIEDKEQRLNDNL